MSIGAAAMKIRVSGLRLSTTASPDSVSNGDREREDNSRNSSAIQFGSATCTPSASSTLTLSA